MTTSDFPFSPSGMVAGHLILRVASRSSLTIEATQTHAWVRHIKKSQTINSCGPKPWQTKWSCGQHSEQPPNCTCPGECVSPGSFLFLGKPVSSNIMLSMYIFILKTPYPDTMFREKRHWEKFTIIWFEREGRGVLTAWGKAINPTLHAIWPCESLMPWSLQRTITNPYQIQLNAWNGG